MRKLLAHLRQGDDTCSAAHLESVVRLCRSENPSGQVDLPGGILAVREYDLLRLTGAAPEGSLKEQELALPGTYRVGSWLLEIREAVYAGERPTARQWWLSRNKISRLSVRSRQEGDTLKLPGRPTKTVKKWLVDEKIPRTRRETLPVLAADGRAVGVARLGMDEGFLPQTGEVCWEITLRESNQN